MIMHASRDQKLRLAEHNVGKLNNGSNRMRCFLHHATCTGDSRASLRVPNELVVEFQADTLD
jgi:hypothetical protein